MSKQNIILFHSPNMTEQSIFAENSRDNCLEPYIKLRYSLLDFGYRLEIAKNQDLDSCKALFFWDSASLGPLSSSEKVIRFVKNIVNKRKNYFQEALKKKLNSRMFFLMVEPPVVCPGNEDHSYHNYFNKILTWETNLVDNVKYFRCLLPYTSNFPKCEKIEFKDKKLLVDISGNKYSEHPLELYSERRKTIQYFDDKYASDFDLYGTFWNENINLKNKYIYKCYRGTIKNKSEILPYYKFAICYENMRDYPDYVSQRIFDVLNSFCVPIYWGASNIEDYVDKKAFIDRRNFQSNNELANYLKNMTEKGYNDYIEAAQDYLKSEKFKLFLPDKFIKTFLNVLNIC